MWQDWVIAIVQWVFIAALVPSLLHPTEKPTLSTSLTTGIAIFVFAFTYATLGLWTSVVSSAMLGTAWLALAYQRWRLNSRRD